MRHCWSSFISRQVHYRTDLWKFFDIDPYPGLMYSVVCSIMIETVPYLITFGKKIVGMKLYKREKGTFLFNLCYLYIWSWKLKWRMDGPNLLFPLLLLSFSKIPTNLDLQQKICVISTLFGLLILNRNNKLKYMIILFEWHLDS